jgi:hypothetical protein
MEYDYLCVSKNWANFYRGEINIDDNVKSQLHLPLLDLNALKTIPSRVSMVHIFTASPTGGLNDSERRAGAWYVPQVCLGDQHEGLRDRRRDDFRYIYIQ